MDAHVPLWSIDRTMQRCLTMWCESISKAIPLTMTYWVCAVKIVMSKSCNMFEVLFYLFQYDWSQKYSIVSILVCFRHQASLFSLFSLFLLLFTHFAVNVCSFLSSISVFFFIRDQSHWRVANTICIRILVSYNRRKKKLPFWIKLLTHRWCFEVRVQVQVQIDEIRCTKWKTYITWHIDWRSQIAIRARSNYGYILFLYKLYLLVNLALFFTLH